MTIHKPDGGVTRLTYHPPNELGMGAGLDFNTGHVAQEADYDSTAAAAPLLRATRSGYDHYGNVSRQQTQLDQQGGTGRWIRNEQAFDFRNRLLVDKLLAEPVAPGAESETRYFHDTLGRVRQKRVETTDPETGGARTYALVEFDYDGSSRLISRETAWEIAGGPTSGLWSGSGRSSVRALAYL